MHANNHFIIELDEKHSEPFVSISQFHHISSQNFHRTEDHLQERMATRCCADTYGVSVLLGVASHHSAVGVVYGTEQFDALLVYLVAGDYHLEVGEGST